MMQVALCLVCCIASSLQVHYVFSTSSIIVLSQSSPRRSLWQGQQFGKNRHGIIQHMYIGIKIIWNTRKIKAVINKMAPAQAIVLRFLQCSFKQRIPKPNQMTTIAIKISSKMLHKARFLLMKLSLIQRHVIKSIKKETATRTRVTIIGPKIHLQQVSLSFQANIRQMQISKAIPTSISSTIQQILFFLSLFYSASE